MRKLLPRERISNDHIRKFAEISLTLEGRGDACIDHSSSPHRAHLSKFLAIIEEQLVFLDRPSQVPPEIVITKQSRVGFAIAVAIEVTEEISAIKKVVSPELKQPTVEFVATTLGDHVDLAACTASKLRTVIPAQDLEF